MPLVSGHMTRWVNCRSKYVPVIALSVMTLAFAFVSSPAANFAICRGLRKGFCLDNNKVWEGFAEHEVGEWRRAALSSTTGTMGSSLSVVAKAPLHGLPVDYNFEPKFEGKIARNDFPLDFVFGTATAAYQVEGAAMEDGRGSSIWDVFSHTPGRTLNGDTGDVACDQYHRFEEDIQLMVNMGVDAYRFSISWPRLFPNAGGAVNQKGVEHYNRLIDALVRNGIQPYVTLYHWDLPFYLHESLGGWLSGEIVGHFEKYAEACFDAFGDRVKHWITFNEPLSFCVLGYGEGIHAPGRCTNRNKCTAGNSTVEPYLAAHNVLKAHAAAVQVYRTKFQSNQKGVIGITCDSQWAEPFTNSTADIAAAERVILFQLGWFFDPIYFGEYPAVMREHLGDRLPKFTKEESALIKGSTDFVGVNHYTSRFVSDIPPPESGSSGFYSDFWAWLKTEDQHGVPIGPRAASEWLYIVPWGLGKLLTWITKRYDSPAIYVTENGMDEENDSSLSLQVALNDITRVKYYHDYLASVASAIDGGANVRGYFAWSFMDNFEWAAGYSKRFGVHFVDYKDDLKRYPKRSATWWTQFLQPKETAVKA